MLQLTYCQALLEVLYSGVAKLMSSVHQFESLYVQTLGGAGMMLFNSIATVEMMQTAPQQEQVYCLDTVNTTKRSCQDSRFLKQDLFVFIIRTAGAACTLLSTTLFHH